MALTPMTKPEGIHIVGEKLFFSLDMSCRLDKHYTWVTSSYCVEVTVLSTNKQHTHTLSLTPLILLSHPTGDPL